MKRRPWYYNITIASVISRCRIFGYSFYFGS